MSAPDVEAVDTQNPARQAVLDHLRALEQMELKADRPATRAWAFRSVGSLLLAHGSWYTPTELPAHIGELPEGECFANAAATEREHPHLRYTEGFAAVVGIPIATAHAWCTTPDGKAVDPTWNRLGGGGAAYFGIILPPQVRPSPRHGSGVLERPETLYPLLQHGLTAST